MLAFTLSATYYVWLCMKILHYSHNYVYISQIHNQNPHLSHLISVSHSHSHLHVRKQSHVQTIKSTSVMAQSSLARNTVHSLTITKVLSSRSILIPEKCRHRYIVLLRFFGENASLRIWKLNTKGIVNCKHEALKYEFKWMKMIRSELSITG